ncbi:hypothetical protein HAX54_024651 [Datura stramonium]|uniref:WRC domain-containing protein n=1 Tax=Datura stramonium TaxID=4076 RepID=A0ABS8RH12_DATST|nr:hypothetical protein [Datura stramonium]
MKEMICNNVADVPAEQDGEMKKDGDNNNFRTIMCCKNDGKGWQCSREAKRGHNLCEHHFSQSSRLRVLADVHRDALNHRLPISTIIRVFGPLWARKEVQYHRRLERRIIIMLQHQEEVKSSTLATVLLTEHNHHLTILKTRRKRRDNEVENYKPMMKRARKPVKARSLKSLM